MKWVKKGLIFNAYNLTDWAFEGAMIPTPFELDGSTIRIFLTFLDKKGIGRTGYVDLSKDNLYEIKGFSKKPIFDIPAIPEILAGKLINNLLEQIKPFKPGYTLSESAKDLEKQKRIYQLSCVNKPSKKLPFQPSFRHLTNFLQINEMDIEKTIASYPEAKTKADKDRIKLRATCAKNWLENHAPEEFKFTIQNEVSKELKLSKEMKEIFKQLSKDLKEKEWTDKELHNHFYTLVKANEVPTAEFFKAAYQILVNKEKGPQLAHFILIIGKERVAELFDKI